MKYEKPEITPLANAAEAIQGAKFSGMYDSSDPTSDIHSTPAYQADE